jgi:hypothetical protein
LPGFTAEATLDKPDARYAGAAAFADQTEGGQVVPQSVSCIQVCNRNGCYLHCVKNPKPSGPIIA